MRLREGEQVSTLAPVIGSDSDPEPEKVTSAGPSAPVAAADGAEPLDVLEPVEDDSSENVLDAVEDDTDDE